VFLAQTNMISLVQHPQHQPPTHIRGTRCIDFIFGSQYINQHIVQSGITPFYEPPWIHTDHRGIFFDINELGLFGANTHNIIPPTIKRLSSLSSKMIQNFIEEIESANTLPTLMQKLKSLEQATTWTQQHHQLLEEIDTTFTSTLLNAEQAIAVPSQYSWSVELDNASSLYSYWLLKVTSNKNNITITKQLDTIARKLKYIDIYQNDKNRKPLLQMRLARKTLINCRLNSEDKRDQQLIIEHDIIVESGQMTLANALRLKINREQQRKCWKLLRSIISGEKTTGGISH
jgi:hypothetical protein